MLPSGILRIPTAAVAITTGYALVFISLDGCDSAFGVWAGSLVEATGIADTFPVFELIRSELLRRGRADRICEATHLLSVTLAGALAAICVYGASFPWIVRGYNDYLIARIRSADKTVPRSASVGLGAALGGLGIVLSCFHMYLYDDKLLFFWRSTSRTYDHVASVI